MAPPAGTCKGKGVGEGEGEDLLPLVQVVYLETGLTSYSRVVPADLSESLKAAFKVGLDKVAKELGVAKKHLQARPTTGPLTKEDGSPFPVEEWVKHYFVAVEASENSGLLAKYNMERQTVAALLNQGVEDVDLTGSSKAPKDVTALQEYISTLEKENATLKADNYTLHDQNAKIHGPSHLQEEIANLMAQNTSQAQLINVLSDQIKQLEEENKLLKEENGMMKDEIMQLKDRVKALEDKNTQLEDRVKALDDKLASLSVMEKVMLRKMLDRCRSRCRQILNIKRDQDWNAVIQNPDYASQLSNAGLTVGLVSTRYGRNSQQNEGLRAAHDVTEDPAAYASIVCKMTGMARERMMNVFQFVFGVSAEGLEFGDEF